MLSNVTVALLFAVGGGTWVYSQVYRRTGGNNQNSLTVAAVAAFFAFLVSLTILNMLSN